MIVSGRPVPHAYDHQAKREPVLENEWTDGSFKAARFTLRNHARLTAGRNTAHLDGDITAYNLSGIDLGFIQGKTPECYRSYHSGSTHCTPNAVLKAENYRALPVTQVRGDITLNDRSELRLGKAHLYGSIRAGKDTAVRMEADSNWTLSQSSHTGALTLDGAQITLNPDFANNTHNNRFNTLTVNGTLDGFGTFRFLTGIVRKQNAPPPQTGRGQPRRIPNPRQKHQTRTSNNRIACTCEPQSETQPPSPIHPPKRLCRFGCLPLHPPQKQQRIQPVQPAQRGRTSN